MKFILVITITSSLGFFAYSSPLQETIKSTEQSQNVKSEFKINEGNEAKQETSLQSPIKEGTEELLLSSLQDRGNLKHVDSEKVQTPKVLAHEYSQTPSSQTDDQEPKKNTRTHQPSRQQYNGPPRYPSHPHQQYEPDRNHQGWGQQGHVPMTAFDNSKWAQQQKPIGDSFFDNWYPYNHHINKQQQDIDYLHELLSDIHTTLPDFGDPGLSLNYGRFESPSPEYDTKSDRNHYDVPENPAEPPGRKKPGEHAFWNVNGDDFTARPKKFNNFPTSNAGHKHSQAFMKDIDGLWNIGSQNSEEDTDFHKKTPSPVFNVDRDKQKSNNNDRLHSNNYQTSPDNTKSREDDSTSNGDDNSGSDDDEESDSDSESGDDDKPDSDSESGDDESDSDSEVSDDSDDHQTNTEPSSTGYGSDKSDSVDNGDDNRSTKSSLHNQQQQSADDVKSQDLPTMGDPQSQETNGNSPPSQSPPNLTDENQQTNVNSQDQQQTTETNPLSQNTGDVNSQGETTNKNSETELTTENPQCQIVTNENLKDDTKNLQGQKPEENPSQSQQPPNKNLQEIPPTNGNQQDSASNSGSPTNENTGNQPTNVNSQDQQTTETPQNQPTTDKPPTQQNDKNQTQSNPIQIVSNFISNFIINPVSRLFG